MKGVAASVLFHVFCLFFVELQCLVSFVLCAFVFVFLCFCDCVCVFIYVFLFLCVRVCSPMYFYVFIFCQYLVEIIMPLS